MGNLFAELKRRHIYRVAAAYAVVAWVLLQLVNNLAPVLDLPVWIARAFLLALIVGFPITVLIAWTRELAPADGTAARAVTGKLDWVLIGALVTVLAAVSYQQLAPTSGAKSEQQSGVAAARSASANVANAISIAVLPFANVSADSSQDFFSDGMTDEIAGALAKVPDLRVVARSSAFQFKGQNQEARAMGQALGATHLIEGSVRKAGNRVRITAQLIQAENGLQIWSENYDRDLTDVFAIQEDIARAITTSLRMPLGLKPGENLVNNRSIDTESYQNHLRGKALFHARAIDEAIKIWEPVVDRDPEFAPTWALLATAYGLAPSYVAGVRNIPVEEGRRIVLAYEDKAESAAQKAIELDSRNANAYASLAYTQYLRLKWAAAEDLYHQALMLDPNDPDVLNGYSIFLTAAGRIKDAMSIREKLRSLEPFVPIYNITLASTMSILGRYADSIPILEAIPADAAGGLPRNMSLAHAYAATGRYDMAADTILLIRGSVVSRQSVEDAARLIRSAPTKVKAPQTLPALERELNFVYAHIGAIDRVMELPERTFKVGYGADTFSLWHPEMAPLRQMARFKSFVTSVGLVGYWRARGWPDLCRPMGADDFECD